jgi:hypothetical protein
MPAPGAPPPWLVFGAMFIVIALFIGLLFVIKAIHMGVQWLTSAGQQPPRPVARAQVLRRQLGRPKRAVRPRPPETPPQPPETHFAPVSGALTPQSDAETIAFHCLAKLVRAGMLTETQALEGSFDVKAGSSKAYQEKRAKLKAALADLDTREAEAREAEARQAVQTA